MIPFFFSKVILSTHATSNKMYFLNNLISNNAKEEMTMFYCGSLSDSWKRTVDKFVVSFAVSVYRIEICASLENSEIK